MVGGRTGQQMLLCIAGNWATDLQGGSAFGYKLLIVILLANFVAIFLQALSLKLGVVAERDLAQACRDAYPKVRQAQALLKCACETCCRVTSQLAWETVSWTSTYPLGKCIGGLASQSAGSVVTGR